MGVGLAAFDGCAIEWTVLYDEMIVVLEGLFRLRAGKEVFEGRPGDIIWIPEKTPIVYEGEKVRRLLRPLSRRLAPAPWAGMKKGAAITPFRHSRESGNPGPQAWSLALDTRFRGHDGKEKAHR
jgi:Ethanolamine utilization protein